MLYIEKIFPKLLVTNIANNFLLMCLNLTSVFSSVSHSTDVFSIWHSKIFLLAYNFILKKDTKYVLHQQSLSYLRDLNILLVSFLSAILRIVFWPHSFYGCLREKRIKTGTLFCMHRILCGPYSKHGHHFAYFSYAPKGT